MWSLEVIKKMNKKKSPPKEDKEKDS
jgi:hypothetical protein